MALVEKICILLAFLCTVVHVINQSIDCKSGVPR